MQIEIDPHGARAPLDQPRNFPVREESREGNRQCQIQPDEAVHSPGECHESQYPHTRVARGEIHMHAVDERNDVDQALGYVSLETPPQFFSCPGIEVEPIERQRAGSVTGRTRAGQHVHDSLPILDGEVAHPRARRQHLGALSERG